jgi:hypothetical protein
MNGTLLNKLLQIENNIKEYINVKFEEQHRLRKHTDINTDIEFSYEYFIKKESNNPDELLIEVDDAHLLIDGILEKFVDWKNPKSKFKDELKKFLSINLCRYFFLI